MCFAGTFQTKTYKFWSSLCEKDRKPKNSVRTKKDLDGNYHFWCVDRKTNKIIDNTPPVLPPDERRIKEDPIYIPWCEEWQKEQRDYCENNLYTTSTKGYGGRHMTREEVDDWMIEIVEEKIWRELKCFTNSYALWKSDPDRYNLVCGSFGWLVDETRDNLIIGLDYGF